jgi:xanthosine utilization system XapX-like protein
VVTEVEFVVEVEFVKAELVALLVGQTVMVVKSVTWLGPPAPPYLVLTGIVDTWHGPAA